jgi:hypothetical protein
MSVIRIAPFSTSQVLFAFRRLAGTDDPTAAFLRFRVDDDHDPAIDRTDREDPILELGVRRIEDLEVVDAGLEEPLGLGEGDAMLPPVAAGLRGVPLELHEHGP